MARLLSFKAQLADDASGDLVSAAYPVDHVSTKVRKRQGHKAKFTV